MVPASEEDSGSMSTLKNYFEDELWKNYSSAAADQSNNGLAQMLYEQMKRNLGTELPKEPDESAVADRNNRLKNAALNPAYKTKNTSL